MLVNGYLDMICMFCHINDISYGLYVWTCCRVLLKYYVQLCNSVLSRRFLCLNFTGVSYLFGSCLVVVGCRSSSIGPFLPFIDSQVPTPPCWSWFYALAAMNPYKAAKEWHRFLSCKLFACHDMSNPKFIFRAFTHSTFTWSLAGLYISSKRIVLSPPHPKNLHIRLC